MTDDPLTVYFAGALFDHKELAGNLLLAQAAEKISAGRFRFVLPQNLEETSTDAIAVRNNDFKQLLSCDMVLANFDGLELDSGTVAEFCAAKFLDMPALLFRTDFRGGGERDTAPDPWNFMCSGWPRSETLRINAMDELHAAAGNLNVFYAGLAEKTAAALDRLAAMPSVLRKEELPGQFGLFLRLLGSGMASVFSGGESRSIVESKIRKNLYR